MTGRVVLITGAASGIGRAADRWKGPAQSGGSLFGVPPSGRPFSGRSISWIMFRDGQMVQCNVLADRGAVVALDHHVGEAGRVGRGQLDARVL
jgi:hypothetical protein